ncbi:MAG TPA: glycosyltransferase family 4 protein [Pyrinomonadaceae bacterium]|jgi:glycosyltransferase involved in cell wall biosynthesis|nr:glycosyltransferase family 4 protein [Pyrinomonadaceae bacterium]
MQQRAETIGAVAKAGRHEAVAKPLRVLIVGPSLDLVGGQARQAARLLAHLREEPSLEVSFMRVTPRLPGPLAKLQQIKYVRTLVTTPLYWAKLLARVRSYDVIHVFSASYYSYLLSAAPAIIIGKLYGVKTILNYRSGEAEDHLQNWRLTAVPTIRLADVIVVPSGYLVDVFARFGLRARPIFNIIELDRFRFRERRPLRPRFLTSRLLEPLYNVGCALRAFALVQKRFPDASLVVAGDGPMRAELEKLARELKLRNTEFIGGIPFEKMAALCDAADIYLNAPNLDNMPSSITECLASGMPVVTTNAGGIPYIVKHEETCLMVERNDHEAMAAAAIRLLEDNELASSIARRGLESCRQYRWAAVQNEWLNLYHELARKGFVEERARETIP